MLAEVEDGGLLVAPVPWSPTMDPHPAPRIADCFRDLKDECRA